MLPFRSRPAHRAAGLLFLVSACATGPAAAPQTDGVARAHAKAPSTQIVRLEALGAIDRALSTNPSYAQAHYARAFIGIHAGKDEAALPPLDQAQRLSPFDPLLFAMKASRAVSLANRAHYEDAALWALRATQEPNAHFHIHAIAAGCLELAGRSAEARSHAQRTRRLHSGYSIALFQRSFPHKDERVREPLLRAMERAGIPRRA